MSLELPLGFGMALAQNEAAMKRFESLSEPEKHAVLARIRYNKLRKLKNGQKERHSLQALVE